MLCNKCGRKINCKKPRCKKCGEKIILEEVGKMSNISTASVNRETVVVSAEKTVPKKKKFAVVYAAVGLAVIAIVCTLLLIFLPGNFKNNEAPKIADNTIYINCTGSEIGVKNKDDALKAINDLKEVFGIDDNDAFELLGEYSTDVGTFYQFEQVFNKVPVYGSGITVAADKDGNVFSISGKYIKIDKEFNTKPKNDEEKIKKLLIDKYDDSKCSDPELVVYVTKDETILAYKAEVVGYRENDEFIARNIIIDENGDELSDENALYFNPDDGETSEKTPSPSPETTAEPTPTSTPTESTPPKNNTDKKEFSIYKADDENWYKKGEHKPIEDYDEVSESILNNLENASGFFKGIDSQLKMDEISVYIHEKVKEIDVEDDEDEVEYETPDTGVFEISEGKEFYFKNLVGECQLISFAIEEGKAPSADCVAHEYAHAVIDKNTAGNLSDKLCEDYAKVFAALANDNIKNLKPDDNTPLLNTACQMRDKGVDSKTLAKIWYNSLFVLPADADVDDCITALKIISEKVLENEEQKIMVFAVLNSDKKVYEMVGEKPKVTVLPEGTDHDEPKVENNSNGKSCKLKDIKGENNSYKVTVTVSGKQYTKYVIVKKGAAEEIYFYTESTPEVKEKDDDVSADVDDDRKDDKTTENNNAEENSNNQEGNVLTTDT